MDTLSRIHTLAFLFGVQGLYSEGVALLREELDFAANEAMVRLIV